MYVINKTRSTFISINNLTKSSWNYTMHWQYLTRTLAINIFYLFQTFINYAIYLTYVCTYTYTYIYTSICMND